MGSFFSMDQRERVLLRSEEIERITSRMAHEITEKNGGIDDLALIGIRSRGADLVRRIAHKIAAITGDTPPVGIIDVTRYRDDEKRAEATAISLQNETPLSIDEKMVVLIDDVIYTGRTVRAALDMMIHWGRPKRILVAALVDRGERELPIKADIVGKNIQVSELERVNVFFRESDGADQVTVSPDPRLISPINRP